MLRILLGILAFLVMLNVIVILHELGHLIAARAFNVHCHEYSIGMGPAIYQKQGKNILFSIRALPIGGYVSMAGEQDNPDEGEEDSWLKDVPQDERLNNKPRWQQIIIMAAGVIVNLLLAYLIVVGIVMFNGRVAQPAAPVIDEVVENMPAASAGIEPGDRIIQIISEDGETLVPETIDDVTAFLQYNHGVNQFLIERNGEEIEISFAPQLDEETQIYLMGTRTGASYRPIAWWESFGLAGEMIWNWTTTIFSTLGMLFQGKGTENLSGPIGIYKVTDQVVSMGFLSYLSLIAMISLNIGIFNLLPIPALDGGRILILLLEGIFRRKIPTQVVTTIILASFVLLFGIMIFATWNDVARYFL